MFKRNPTSAAVIAAIAAMSLDAMASEPAGLQTLPEVQVTAAGELPATQGYGAYQSRSSTKTDTPLRDTPQSVSVVTREQIQDQSVQSLADAVRYSPGVSFAQGEGNRDAVIIRGSTSTGDFFIDGIRDDVQYYRDVYNIDRIEVLKGANGLAFGRGGAGGVVNRVSKEAGWSPVREVGVSLGSWGHQRATLDVGQGLSARVAGRVNLVTEDSESYRDGVELRRNGISPTLTIKPSDDTRIVLGGEFFNDKRVADRGVPSRNGKPFATDASTFFGNADQSPTETTVNSFNAGIEKTLKNGVVISNKTRYADYDKYYQNVYADSAVNGAGMVTIRGYVDDTQRENLFNQTDVIFKFATGEIAHQVVTGLELGSQDTKNFRFNATFGGGPATSATVSASNPKATATAFNTLNRRSESTVKVTSVYAQDQIDLTPKLQAILGLRQDRFDVDFTNRVSLANIDLVDTRLSPRAALVYKPVEAVSLYASYSQTFVPRAGDQLTSLTAANSAFDPEEFVNREVGVKWDAPRGFSVTAALYKLERNNVAVTNPDDITETILVNGQEVKGFELGISGQITSAWSVVGGYSHADSEITRNQTATIVAGNETSQTPRHTFSLWNRYDFNDTYGAALGVISRSEMYALDDNSVLLPGYARLDAALYMNVSKKLKLQLNLENLLDEEYAQSAHNSNNIMPGSPLAARATATLSF